MAKWMTGPVNFGQKKDRRPNPSREEMDLPSFQMREMIDKEGTERMYPDPGGPDFRQYTFLMKIPGWGVLVNTPHFPGSKPGMTLQTRQEGLGE